MSTAFLLLTSKTDKISGIQSFVVLTGSMQPAIPQGSVTFTKHQISYKKGNVISFKLGNIIVTHRIVNVNKDNSFVTKGDANNASDSGPVLKNNILGKEIVFIPYLGLFLLFLKTIPGFIVFVIVPALIFIGAELMTIKKELEKEIEKKLLGKISLS